jgi:hypothetical protein
MFVEVLAKYLIQVVRCIWQGLPQTYINSLTISNKSSNMYFTKTSTKVYSQFNKI